MFPLNVKQNLSKLLKVCKKKNGNANLVLCRRKSYCIISNVPRVSHCYKRWCDQTQILNVLISCLHRVHPNINQSRWTSPESESAVFGLHNIPKTEHTENLQIWTDVSVISAEMKVWSQTIQRYLMLLIYCVEMTVLSSSPSGWCCCCRVNCIFVSSVAYLITYLLRSWMSSSFWFRFNFFFF